MCSSRVAKSCKPFNMHIQAKVHLYLYSVYIKGVTHFHWLRAFSSNNNGNILPTCVWFILLIRFFSTKLVIFCASVGKFGGVEDDRDSYLRYYLNQLGPTYIILTTIV
ncbi:hypothetical protein K445DRAFT_175387 [Daldinia sp. EC12]|nr:hypothetical protein F4774DRAFT_395894 [Daldinia eschscholtzii]OTB12785.1 hypothetical protein K445DRAFT_175387 [Daldinia sp. EC12]